MKTGHPRDLSSTFTPNMRLPVHRWYRYSAGFSADWAEEVITSKAAGPDALVLDPFVGSGTTLLAAEQVGVPSWGLDSHPFVARIAKAKLDYRSSPTEYFDEANRALLSAKAKSANIDIYSPLIRKCYSDESLAQLDCLKQAVLETEDTSPSSRLVWLTLVAILRSTAQVGTATWQYVFPNKRKSTAPSPFDAFAHMAQDMYHDMCLSNGISGPRARLDCHDARTCDPISDDQVTLVLTSPPYANNYDYADATRLELTFFGEVGGWGDLQQHVRQYLIRSCTQQVPDRAINISDILSREELGPIREDLTDTCSRLDAVRRTKGGKKPYHNMIACYFLDLAHVWSALRRVCKSSADICYVIGDSAPYGVYVPTMTWLGELAVAAGFKSYHFTKTRDRNVKWKNRKHRVPLCEGHLWVEG